MSTQVETIELEETFGCRPQNIYEAFIDQREVMRYTMAPASIDARVGGTFSMFDGSLHGEFDELVPYEKIVMKWRFRQWPDNHYSNVSISLSPVDDNITNVHLTQTNVPIQDNYGNDTVIENTTNGWKGNIFKRIKDILGYQV